MRILLTGGGTGGHVNPALAIADIIKMNDPDAKIAFVGTPRGIENQLVEREGYPMYHVNIQGVRRSLSPANLKTAYLVLTSPSRAAKIIREFKPDLVIGTGGYVCWPLLRAASSMGVPCMVHESNALPGMAIRQLQSRVDVILTNFKETKELLHEQEKVVEVGNPLRSNYATVTREEARRKLGIPDHIGPVILSFGGSLGARRINEAAIWVMKNYSAEHGDVMHFHSGGTRGYENARSLFSSYGLERNERLVLREYIYDMPLHMAAADLIICRAGAMTLTELAKLKKPAILIPSPNVADNHQYKNAKVLADAGAALLLEEQDLTEESIVNAVRSILEDRDRAAHMSAAVSAHAVPDAEKRIYEEMVRLMEEGSRRKK